MDGDVDLQSPQRKRGRPSLTLRALQINCPAPLQDVIAHFLTAGRTASPAVSVMASPSAARFAWTGGGFTRGIVVVGVAALHIVFRLRADDEVLLVVSAVQPTETDLGERHLSGQRSAIGVTGAIIRRIDTPQHNAGAFDLHQAINQW